jgi:hypothetical protein
MNRVLSSATLTIMMWLIPTYTFAAELTLIDDGEPRCSIVLPDDASEALRETAQDVSDLIAKMSGAWIPISPSASGASIRLGPVDSELEPLAYHVRREGDDIVVSGGSDQGVVNGAYAFMVHLGARFYLPGELGTYVPAKRTIDIGDLDISDAPDYKSVSGFGGHPVPGLGRQWVRRNQLEGFPHQYHSHNWTSIIHPRLRDVHPELFALQEDGSRSDQLCTTHPEVLDSAVVVINRYFDMRSDVRMYSLSPNDNDDFCRCERCLTLDEEIGVDPVAPGVGYTDRLIYFFNQIAEQVEPRHPDKQLAFYAYINHTEPPRVVTPHPMLLPVACHTPWDYCQNHAIDDQNCSRNSKFAAVIAGWDSLSAETYVYDYYGQFAWFGPMGIVHAIRRDLPWLNRHGVVGFNSETHQNWWTQGLGFYVASKLFWDLDADVDAIVREWHENLYGPAAPPMAAYWQMYEDAAANVPYDRDVERGWVTNMNREFFARTDLLLSAADDAVRETDLSHTESSKISERIRRMRIGDQVAQQQVGIEQFDATGDISAILASGSPRGNMLDIINRDSSLIDVIDLELGPWYLERANTGLAAYRAVWDDTNLSDAERDSLLALFEAGRVDDVAHGLGFIADWKILGIFYSPASQGLMHPFPPETTLDLSARYESRSGEIGWRDHRVDNAFGIIDFRHFFPGEDIVYAVAYAYCEVDYWGRKSRGTLRLGSNDGVSVWHNGERVLISDIARPCKPDQDRLMVPLTRGTNRFLVKVYNTQNNFKMTMRVLDDQGRPIPQGMPMPR